MKNKSLMKCEVCEAKMAFTAEKCPSCGATNSWIHPEIENLICIKDQLELPKFHFQWNKVEVWGVSKSMSWKYWTATIFFMLLGFFFGLVPGIIVLGIAMVIMEIKKKTFKANLQSGAWESSDDVFWRPIKEALKL